MLKGAAFSRVAILEQLSISKEVPEINQQNQTTALVPNCMVFVVKLDILRSRYFVYKAQIKNPPSAEFVKLILITFMIS